MKIITISNLFSILFLFAVTTAPCVGQVSFGIELLEDNRTYEVSMRSDTDVDFPKNRIGTAQVTIKVPTNTNFDVKNLVSFYQGAEWAFNSRVDAPEEESGFDYLFFGLLTMGTNAIPIEAGKKVTLFSFENTADCPGEVNLVDNQSDPFVYPNSVKVSIKNHVSILAMGMHTYGENFLNGASCRSITSDDTPITTADISLEPNPAQDVLRLKNKTMLGGPFDIEIFDLTGKKLMHIPFDIPTESTSYTLDISQLESGCYVLHVIKEKELSAPLKFIVL